MLFYFSLVVPASLPEEYSSGAGPPARGQREVFLTFLSGDIFPLLTGNQYNRLTFHFHLNLQAIHSTKTKGKRGKEWLKGRKTNQQGKSYKVMRTMCHIPLALAKFSFR